VAALVGLGALLVPEQACEAEVRVAAAERATVKKKGEQRQPMLSRRPKSATRARLGPKADAFAASKVGRIRVCRVIAQIGFRGGTSLYSR